jgi:hypothetical protein
LSAKFILTLAKKINFIKLLRLKPSLRLKILAILVLNLIVIKPKISDKSTVMIYFEVFYKYL